MIRRNEATEMQVRAATPGASTWLSANAGSGKTRVLTDRVARLLLDGVSPQHILCLTYTTAAASEMQNRLFKRLGVWAMQGTDELTAELRELGFEHDINTEELQNARRLFARAIETPGGLKIQTIHSFCASLLRRFPLEAGVSPQFKEMDERTSKLLRANIVEEMAEGEDVSAIEAIAAYHYDSDLDKLTSEIAKYRELFGGGTSVDDIWKIFGLKAGFNAESIHKAVLLGGERELLKSVLPYLENGKATDVKAAGKIREALRKPDQAGLVEGLELAFLTQAGIVSKRGTPTKDVALDLGDLFDPLEKLKARIEEGKNLKNSLYSAEKTLALYKFANRFLPLYAEQKQQKGWLDFDDLILLTAKLLNNPAVAQWVLFRLDGGINHILVDEAQDTSPQQWHVIERLAQEFSAGEGTHSGQPRTIFVVGDEKQSIYSFQGADPDEFDRMKRHFAQKLAEAHTPLNELQLTYSFRSAEPIMRLVDCTFQNRDGLDFASNTKHIAFKEQMPGRVDHWPMIAKSDAAEQKEWYDPTDMLANNNEKIILARQVAENIRKLCDNGDLIPQEIGNSGKYEMRPVTEGDFLILVRNRRSGLFQEIIRACKSAGLAIAGADRLKIGGELAVKDLTALLSFLATPEDDLSLAAVLRSPLFDWDEQALFDLAHKREKGSFLWAALRNQDRHQDDLEILNDLRKHADFLRPYELLERVLTRFEGRKNLLARLGAEAEDGIDALLDQAMNYERLSIPSLTGFITWMQTEEVEIKRQMDSGSNQIRVMTVHGAKGLESPIVILPDTAEWPLRIRGEIYQTDAGPVWQVTADKSPEIVSNTRDIMRQNQKRERMRLLYVAMTRAEKWLIICGAGTDKNGQSWHGITKSGMETAGAVQHSFDNGPGLRLQSGDWTGPLAEAKPDSEQATATLPDWALQPAETPARPAKALSPSDLGGAKAIYNDDQGLSEEQAMQRGSRIHVLLEHLPNHPRPDWPQLAKNMLPDCDEAAFNDIFNEVHVVLTHPDLAFIFAPGTLSEVPVFARPEAVNGQSVYGEVDRLVISEDHILIVDFKSNAVVPATEQDVPDGILRQMGAYKAMLEMVYPNHRIETAILWTNNASLMRLAPETVNAAFCQSAMP
ncbi:MAG: double-strand break repair helicase AddA [Rhodobacterales bacterium]|nr:MAG: double-strand break repair helicase AddA [Rhodobacterales bacterium]